MKLLLLLLSCMVNTALAGTVATPCLGTQQNPCIVEDTQHNNPDLKNWRDTALTLKMYQGNTSGLADLWVSGSAMPSAAGWSVIADHIKQATHHQAARMVDVDLRQESHGYLNDNAITLAAQNDWGNLGKSRKQVLVDERNWLYFLGKSRIIPNILSVYEFDAQEYSGKPILLRSSATEKSVAEHAGFAYFRLTVPDHMPPSDADVDRFVALVKSLPPKTWLHVHCRGGEGRTTTFLVLFDMLHNANKVSFNDIIERAAATPPYYNLTATERKHSVYVHSYEKRLRFLKRFYQYANATLTGYKGTWTEWNVQHA